MWDWLAMPSLDERILAGQAGIKGTRFEHVTSWDTIAPLSQQTILLFTIKGFIFHDAVSSHRSACSVASEMRSRQEILVSNQPSESDCLIDWNPLVFGYMDTQSQPSLIALSFIERTLSLPQGFQL